MENLSFAAFSALPHKVITFSKLIRGFEDKDVIQLTKPKVNTLLQKLDQNKNEQAFSYLQKLLESWSKEEIAILFNYAINIAGPFLLQRRDIILNENKKRAEANYTDIRIEKISLYNKRIAEIKVHLKTLEIILAGDSAKNILSKNYDDMSDFNSNPVQEEYIRYNEEIKELHEKILNA